jgi:hypothetical protein
MAPNIAATPTRNRAIGGLTCIRAIDNLARLQSLATESSNQFRLPRIHHANQ